MRRGPGAGPARVLGMQSFPGTALLASNLMRCATTRCACLDINCAQLWGTGETSVVLCHW